MGIYIEITMLDDDGLPENYGLKIEGAELREGGDALTAARALAPVGGVDILAARFITREEYYAEYGEEDTRNRGEHRLLLPRAAKCRGRVCMEIRKGGDAV